MGRVSEAFNSIVMLEDGQKMLIKVEDEKKLASIRTLLHREKKAYELATGRTIPMACSTIIEDDGTMFLEVKNEPLEFKIVEDTDA